MIWKAKYTQEIFQDGATRLKRTFAWFPFKIDGDVVWLQYYETFQRYTIEAYKVTFEGKEKAVIVGEWVNLSNRIIK